MSSDGESYVDTMNPDNHFFHHMEKKKRKRDGVKLFVGQIPSTMDETTLDAFLSDYATILDVTILRDRKTNINKRRYLILNH